MPRQDFEQHLEALQSEMLEMGSMVATAISRSTAALVNRDLSLAEQVIAEDLLINRKRYDIEEMAIELIAMQQPLARDLRVIIAVLNVIVDLERIGDHTTNIAETVYYAVRGETLPDARPKGDNSPYAVVRPQE